MRPAAGCLSLLTTRSLAPYPSISCGIAPPQCRNPLLQPVLHRETQQVEILQCILRRRRPKTRGCQQADDRLGSNLELLANREAVQRAEDVTVP